MIEALALTKRYGKKLAVDAVSFFVDRGEVVGLLGPNGAGKSTIMRMLTGFMPPSAGTARVAGFDVVDQPMEVKRRIGYLPETPPLYPEMRVLEYLLFAAALRLVPRARRRAAVDAALARCGLADVARRRIEHLSKGYRQRVGLAQAILHQPEMIILDEPTSGLDPHQVLEVRALIRGLADNTTVLVSSHVLSEVSATCSRVIILNRGKLVAAASPDELRARLAEGGVQIVFLAFSGPVADVLARLRAVPGVGDVTEGDPSGADGSRHTCRVRCVGRDDARNDLARCVLDAGARLLEMREDEFSLEQAFIRLTRED